MKSNSPEMKPPSNDQNSRSPVAPSNGGVQIEVIQSQSPQQTAPTNPQHQAPSVEVVQILPTQSCQHPVAAPVEDPLLQNVRSSKNNFYMKNQSNIFNTGFNPYQAQGTMQQSMRNSVADKIVVENALRIASQQPLPAPPSFSVPRGNVRPEENMNQRSSVPNNRAMVQNSLPSTYPETVMTVQPPSGTALQDHSDFIQSTVSHQQRFEHVPTVNESKPMNSKFQIKVITI